MVFQVIVGTFLRFDLPLILRPGLDYGTKRQYEAVRINMIAHPILRSEIQDMSPDAREVLSLRSEGLIGAAIA